MQRIFTLIVMFFSLALTSNAQVLINQPNGGEQINPGQVYTIKWALVGGIGVTNMIDIDYSTDNATTWKNIATNINGTSGSYSWNVPYEPSSTCYIRITNGGNSDFSDQTFTILSTSVGIEELANSKALIFPSPANHSTTIDNGNEAINSLKLFNLLGEEVARYNFENGESKQLLELNNVPAGVYMVQVNDAKVIAQKLVVTH